MPTARGGLGHTFKSAAKTKIKPSGTSPDGFIWSTALESFHLPHFLNFSLLLRNREFFSLRGCFFVFFVILGVRRASFLLPKSRAKNGRKGPFSPDLLSTLLVLEKTLCFSKAF